MQLLPALLFYALLLAFPGSTRAAESLSLGAPKFLPREHGLDSSSPLVQLGLGGFESGWDYTVCRWLLEADSGNCELGSIQAPWLFRVRAGADSVPPLHAQLHDVFCYRQFRYAARLFREGIEVASAKQPATGLNTAPPIRTVTEHLQIKVGAVLGLRPRVLAHGGEPAASACAEQDARTGQSPWQPTTKGRYRSALVAHQSNGLFDIKVIQVEASD